MKSPPVLDRADQDPEVQAAEARAAGESIIRNHLDNYLAHNSGASSDYISWIATLHPENAQVEIDERFFTPGNPWWTIYEETVNMPYATAVPIPAAGAGDEEAGGQHQQQPKPRQDNVTSTTHEEDVKYVSSNTSHTSGDDLTEQPSAPPAQRPPKNIPHYCLRCNPVDMLLGLITTFHAILITFVLELIALVFYFTAAFFYHIAQAIGPNGIFTGFFYSFFMVMYFAFATVDSSVLLASVVGAETTIFIGWIVGCFFGGIWVANKRHQFVRRVCHRIRWAFRNKQLEPPRTFCKQRQIGTEQIEDQHEDNERANAELEKEFEIDDYEAHQNSGSPPAAHYHDYNNREQNQPKADIEEKSARPY